MEGWSTTCKSIDMTHHINKLKNKNLSRYRKSFWQNSMSIYDKTSQQNGYKRGKPQHMKGLIMTHPQPTSYSDSEKLKALLRSRTKHVCPLSLLLFIIVWNVLARGNRLEKEIKGIQIGKEDIKLSLFAVSKILYIENSEHTTKKYYN